MQPAGALYFAFADSWNHTNRIYCNVGIRVMSVFMHITELYMRGFKYNTCMYCYDLFCCI